jgi:hypothetical protein
MWQKIELYIISLWFLFVLLFANNIHIPVCFRSDCAFMGFKTLVEMNVIAIISILFIVLGAVFYLRFNYKIVKAAPTLPKTIAKIEDSHFENLTFLITYIIPFVGFDLNITRNRLTLVLMLILIGGFYVQANMFYTNPSLAVLGYRIYRLDTSESSNMIVIVKGRLHKGDSIYSKKIDENIYFVTRAQR